MDSQSEVYCLPAAWDGVEKSGRYLICILLQSIEQKGEDQPSTFKRIGLTKIANRRNVQKNIIESSRDIRSIPNCPWDEEAGGHTIRII